MYIKVKYISRLHFLLYSKYFGISVYSVSYWYFGIPFHIGIEINTVIPEIVFNTVHSRKHWKNKMYCIICNRFFGVTCWALFLTGRSLKCGIFYYVKKIIGAGCKITILSVSRVLSLKCRKN